mmetsp:Transcript_113/g.136  ORF Transcript_113/g.136 Transcript_113/m.136 type:complete len:86 (-) Transcript_113:295-552(-)
MRQLVLKLTFSEFIVHTILPFYNFVSMLNNKEVTDRILMNPNNQSCMDTFSVCVINGIRTSLPHKKRVLDCRQALPFLSLSLFPS